MSAGEATGSHLTPSEPSPRVPAPLHLGTDGRTVLIGRVVDELACITTPDHYGAELTKRGAGLLGRWLLTWARPQASTVLWGIEGIATKCKVSRTTVYNWTAKEDFPPSMKVIGGNGPVWEAEAVKAWVVLMRQPGGRPRKAT